MTDEPDKSIGLSPLQYELFSNYLLTEFKKQRRNFAFLILQNISQGKGHKFITKIDLVYLNRKHALSIFFFIFFIVYWFSFRNLLYTEDLSKMKQKSITSLVTITLQPSIQSHKQIYIQ